MVSLGFEDVINFILDALPVSNLKPDTADAEDGEKMSMVLSAAEGDDSGDSTLALYRQTVRAASLARAEKLTRHRSCSPLRCLRPSSVSRRSISDVLRL